jgi:hypothetical protein
MLTALIGILGLIVGILLGGVVQVGVARYERKQSSKRAARLLFGDHYLALSAIESMGAMEFWWSEEAAPPLDDWRRYREALASAMWGPDFQTVDGAFHRVANLETWRRAGLEAADCKDDAIKAANQLKEAGGILLVEGFSGRELAQLEREMDDLHAEASWVTEEAEESKTENSEP